MASKPEVQLVEDAPSTQEISKPKEQLVEDAASGQATSESSDGSTTRRKSSFEMAKEKEEAEYLETMDKEIKGWDELYAQRMRALRLAQREAAKPMVLTYENVKDHLTEEERAFLNARPDYKGLVQRAKNALIANEIALEEKREYLLRATHLVGKIEQQVREDTATLIKMKDPVLDS